MTDKPILFSAPMICALLAGTKTQTRRKLPSAHPKFPELNVLSLDALIDPQQVWYWDGKHDRVGASYRIPIAPGDRLWVKETWRVRSEFNHLSPTKIGEDEGAKSAIGVWYEADDNKGTLIELGRTRSSIHMPRWASRLTLTVTEVRVQRLQEISGEDCIAEGACEAAMLPLTDDDAEEARQAFRTLWNSIHGPDAWDRNPWVYALTFDVHRGNIDQMDT